MNIFFNDCSAVVVASGVSLVLLCAPSVAMCQGIPGLTTPPELRTAKQGERCDESIEKLAIQNLSEEHKKVFGTKPLWQQTGIGNTINSISNVVSIATTGTTDTGRALRAWNQSRIAAVRYKAHWCTQAEPTAASGSSTEMASASTVTSSPEGTMVKGLEDWEGEVSGRPLAGGRFESLMIGMRATHVLKALGDPDDQKLAETLKALAPGYFGPDKFRYESVYKGAGRLVFSSAPGIEYSDFYLIKIVHDAANAGKL